MIRLLDTETQGCGEDQGTIGGKNHSEKLRQAQAVRATCLEAAIKTYEQASISGLCGEGAWEVARGAIQTLDLKRLIELDQQESK